MTENFSDMSSTKIVDAFRSPTFENMLRLMGTSRICASDWPNKPEEVGLDFSAKENMSQAERENYDFWVEVANPPTPWGH